MSPAPTDAQVHEVAEQLAQQLGAEVETHALTAVAPPVTETAAEGPVPWAPTPRGATEHKTPTRELAAELLTAFDAHLADARIELDRSASVDLLAAFLSTQFLLFAGPSGTGKSTTARALTHIFCTPNSSGVIEARRQMLGPEDVAGYYSPLSDSYVTVPDLRVLRQLATEAEDAAPALLVEEINLSAVEGYLAPFTHGLSGLSQEFVTWDLHDGSVDDPPDELVLGPYPRLLGTINVDATAPAPARKVAARACVILLEPVAEPDIAAALQRLRARGQPNLATEGAGAPLVGNPLEIFSVAVADDSLLAQHVADLLDLIRGSGAHAAPGAVGATANAVSRRQVDQMLTYASWFVLLAKAFETGGGTLLNDSHRLAVENGILHFVLPTLPGPEFTVALERLQTANAQLSGPGDPQQLGALLLSRVERLATAGNGALGLGQILDFWDRLS